MPRCYLRATVNPVCSIFIFNKDICIQVQIHAIAIEYCSYLDRVKPGYICHCILNMCSDVAHAVRNAWFLWIRSPHRHLRSRLVSGTDFINQPVLKILSIDVNYRSNFPASNHIARQLNHTIAGIGICHRKKEPFLTCQPLQFFAFLCCKAQGFLTYHVDSRF